MAEVSD